MRNLLTDRRIRTARPRAKPYRLFDGDGLALWISPTGAKSWQLRYRLDGKAQTATLGKLERLSLSDARTKADELRKLADEGEHLTVVKRLDKVKRYTEARNTFDVLAAAWIAREARRMKWTPDYRGEVEASLRNHCAPLNGLPIAKITAPVVAPVLQAIEHRAPLMVEKVRRRLNAVLDYGVELGAIPGNPLPALRRGPKRERKHYPAVTDLPHIGEILRKARAADPCKGVQRAHMLAAFTGMRVSELVNAKWDEFALDTAAQWSIPRERMKRKDPQRGPHVVPLSPRLLAALREWRAADDPGAVYVCPAPRDASQPITPEALERHYRVVLGLGGKHSPHSWRSTFSTICRDAGKPGDLIEAQLDHVVGTAVQAAYDRAKRLLLRRELMAWYEEQLIAARDGAKVLPMKKRT